MNPGGLIVKEVYTHTPFLAALHGYLKAMYHLQTQNRLFILEEIQMRTRSSESHRHLPSLADLVQAACTAQTGPQHKAPVPSSC